MIDKNEVAVIHVHAASKHFRAGDLAIIEGDFVKVLYADTHTMTVRPALLWEIVLNKLRWKWHRFLRFIIRILDYIDHNT